MLSKMPPIEKIYEAWSAIGDGRVHLHEDYALVDSSDHSKTYEVSWKENLYRSSDNATYWQGYPGYPILAVLMMQGKLPYREDLSDRMKNLPWKQLNDSHKRDYASAAREAFQQLDSRGVDTSHLEKEALECYKALENLDIEVGRGRKKVTIHTVAKD